MKPTRQLSPGARIGVGAVFALMTGLFLSAPDGTAVATAMPKVKTTWGQPA